jgi:hypothetical protein
MKRLIWVGVALVAAGSLAVPLWPAHGTPPSVASGCGGGRPAARADIAGLARGGVVGAADGGAIAIAGRSRDERVVPPDRRRGQIRHVASRTGVGTAYVRDLPGGDVVVAVTVRGVRRFPTTREALHPSWSSRGDLVWAEGANLRLVPPNATAVRAVRGPVAGGLAFAPVFASDGSIVTGVAAPPAAAVPEDEYLSDLWRYEPGTGRWRQLTHFRGGADAWTIVRTPVVMGDGAIEFVRIQGRAPEDAPPGYELWELRAGSARRLRTLSSEMYLAGRDGAARLWNVRDGDTGAWRIERERADGSLEPVGCGAVMVDPLDRPDPDARPGIKLATVDPTAGGDARSSGSAVGPQGTSAVDAILVGDFSSTQDAGAAAEHIQAAFGATASVIDPSDQPAILRPGVWAVLVPLPSGTDGIQALARFRLQATEFSGWSWLVSI